MRNYFGSADPCECLHRGHPDADSRVPKLVRNDINCLSIADCAQGFERMCPSGEHQWFVV
jgi:hypothetical protein